MTVFLSLPRLVLLMLILGKTFFAVPSAVAVPAVALDLLNGLVLVTAGNGSVTIASSGGTAAAGSQQSGGCILSYSGSRPLYTSGFTVLPPQSKDQPSITVPCDEFLAHAYQYAQAHPMATVGPSRPLATMFTDTNLTGCYAMTGGSTVFTATRGEYLPATVDASQTASETMVTADAQTLTIACSDFLRLQGGLPSLALSFMRSPVCTSYAQKYQQEFLNHSITDAPELDYPLGVYNTIGPNHWYCCGGCRFYAPDMGVLYWSTTAAPDCSKSNGTITSQASLPSGLASFRAGTETSSFAVLNGSTFTFPSLYVTFRGAITVKDRCGIKGSIYQNPTIAVPPNGLSTLSYPSKALGADLGMTKGLYNPEMCPTYGVSNPSLSSFWFAEANSSVWTTTTYHTIGPPYNPIMLPPQGLINMDPEWKSCTEWYSQGVFAGFEYGLFDPPRALTPVASMSNPMNTGAGYTTQTHPTVTSKSFAEPASTWYPNVPTTTATASKSNSEMLESSVVSASSSIASSYLHASTFGIETSSIISSSSAISTSSNSDPTASTANSRLNSASSSIVTSTYPPKTGLSDPSPGSSSSTASSLASLLTASAANTIVDRPMGPTASQPGKYSDNPHQPLSGSVAVSYSDQSLAATGVQSVEDTMKSQPTSGGLGPMILSGLGITDLTIISQQETSQQNRPSEKASSSTPLGVLIAESVISNGGAAITISGTHLSFGSASLVVGSETLSLQHVDSSAVNPVQQTVNAVPKPSVIALAGSTLSVGGPSETVSGIPLSLAPSGILVVSGSPGAPSLSVNTVVGQSSTGGPTDLSVMRTMTSTGIQDATISGTLETSSYLVKDSSVASSGRSPSTVAGQLSTTAATEPVTSTAVAATDSGTTISNSSMSSLTTESFISSSTDASFTSATTASFVGTIPTESDGVTLSGTAVVLKPSGTLVIAPSGTITLPSSSQRSATNTQKGAQARVEIPRLGILLVLLGAISFVPSGSLLHYFPREILGN